MARPQLSTDPSLNEEFQDWLHFEKRVFDFLKTSDLLLDCIGANFSMASFFDEVEKESSFSTVDIELARRETILKLVRLAMPDADWEANAPFYSDQELYRFIVTALLKLPVGSRPKRQTVVPAQGIALAKAFLKKHDKDRPSAKVLLKWSSLFRHAFELVAKFKDRKFNLDLRIEANQDIALKMLHAKRFGSIQEFMAYWLISAYGVQHEQQVATFIEHNIEELDLEDRIKTLDANKENALSFHNAYVGNYFARFMGFTVAGNPSYSKEEVLAAIQEALYEHHDIVKTLIAESEKSKAETPTKLDSRFEYIHSFEYEPRNSAPLITADPGRLESYIEKLIPLDQLKAETDYKIAFTRDFGLRQKVFTVRLTPRGLSQLLQWDTKKFHGLEGTDWLKALQKGGAAPGGESGLKLLKSSPIRGLPHLLIELKHTAAGDRWLGFRDKEKRYVFDVFHDDHH